MSAAVAEAIQVDAVSVELSAHDFINAVKAVAIAAGSDSALPVLASVSVSLLDHGIALVATDRYRLAEARHGSGSVQASVLVNAKELLAFVKTIKLSAKEYPHGARITVTVDPGLVTVSGAGMSRIFRTVDATFPPHAHLIPSEDPVDGVAVTALDEGFLVDAAKACALMNTGSGVMVSLYAGDRKPVLFRPRTVIDGWEYLYLLMPQRLIK